MRRCGWESLFFSLSRARGGRGAMSGGMALDDTGLCGEVGFGFGFRIDTTRGTAKVVSMDRDEMR